MWKEFLNHEKAKEYFIKLDRFIAERDSISKVYPPVNERLLALELCPIDKTKVVILGQDPYHGDGQAHGLSFSVPKKCKIPPSLRNIYKELESDLGIEMPEHGCLKKWAEQGVLLLNTVLTVEQGRAGSHQKKGWEIFTDHLLQKLNEEKSDLVFLLWGSMAHKKGLFLNDKRHLILKSVHPSPLSAYRGFFGCKHFSKCNDYLTTKGLKPIDWSLS